MNMNIQAMKTEMPDSEAGTLSTASVESFASCDAAPGLGGTGHRPVAAGDSPAAPGAPGMYPLVRAPPVPELGGKLPPRTAKLAVPPGTNGSVPAVGRSALPVAATTGRTSNDGHRMPAGDFSAWTPR